MNSRTTELHHSYNVLLTHYKDWLITLGFSKSITYSYPKMLYYFLGYLQDNGIHHISQAKQQHITAYYNHLQERSSFRRSGALSIAHLNKHFDCVDKCCEFLCHYHSSAQLYATGYRIKEERHKTPKVLTQGQVQQLYDGVADYALHMGLPHRVPRQATATLLLDLCYGCGLRRSEAYNVTINDIDFDRHCLFVKQGKNYKDRFIPMSMAVSKRLQCYLYEHRRYYNCKHARIFPHTKDFMQYLIHRLGKQAGLLVTLHTLRHSIATHLLQQGMSLERIARFLGHSSLESTQRYTHLLEDGL